MKNKQSLLLRNKLLYIAIFATVMFFSASQTKAAIGFPIPTPTPIPTTSPTSTPIPTSIPIPTPTSTPVPTPSPTPLSSPSPTPITSFIRVTSPNGGETIKEGDTYRITWNSSGVDRVSIGYYPTQSCGPNCFWLPATIAVDIPNTGYYDWKVIVASSSEYNQFKIIVGSGYSYGLFALPTDISDNPFTIIRAKRSPCNDFGDVNMDGIITEEDARDTLRIVANLPSLLGTPYSDEQKRRANVDTRNNNVTSVDALMIKRYIAGLDTTFRACTQPTPFPSVRITYPNGGESFTTGRTVRVRWELNNVNTCNLGYTFNGILSYYIATINNPSSGYYDWSVNVGNISAGTQAKIGISCTSYNGDKASDQSDNFFTVYPASSSAARKATIQTPKSKPRQVNR